MSPKRFSKEELREIREPLSRQERAVRLQEVDAAGVVFFARVLEFCHDALMAHLEARGLPVARLLAEGRYLTPIKHAEAHYLAPLRFGDRIAVLVLGARVEETEVTVGFRVERESDGAIAAVAQTTHVCVDARSFQRTPLPPEWVRIAER